MGEPRVPPSALRALSSLGGLRGGTRGAPLRRETSVSRTANVGMVSKNWLKKKWQDNHNNAVFRLLNKEEMAG